MSLVAWLWKKKKSVVLHGFGRKKCHQLHGFGRKKSVLLHGFGRKTKVLCYIALEEKQKCHVTWF